jgi:hypothetical protein
MFGRKRHKHSEEHRYYLLPSMGRSNRKRHRNIFWWSVVVGGIISVLFGGLLYCLNNPRMTYFLMRH